MNWLDKAITWARANLPKEGPEVPPLTPEEIEELKNTVYVMDGGYVNGFNQECDAEGNVLDQPVESPTASFDGPPMQYPLRQAPRQPEDPYAGYDVVQTAGFHTRIQRGWIKAAIVVGVFLVWGVAGYGVSEWLAGYKPLSWDFGTLFWYVVGFGIEFLGIAFLFVAARAKEKRGIFWGALFIAMFVALSSFFGQYLLLYSEAFRSFLSFPPHALDGLPIDERGVILFRAAIPSVIELGLVFLVAERKPDVHETIAQKRKIAHEVALLKDEEGQLAQMELARTAVSAYMGNVTRMLQKQVQAMSSDQELIEEHIQPRLRVVHVHDEPSTTSQPAPQTRQYRQQPPQQSQVVQTPPTPVKPPDLAPGDVQPVLNRLSDMTLDVMAEDVLVRSFGDSPVLNGAKEEPGDVSSPRGDLAGNSVKPTNGDHHTVGVDRAQVAPTSAPPKINIAQRLQKKT